MTEKTAAEKWRVSAKWIQKIKKQRRKTGSLEPVKGNPGPKMKLIKYRPLLTHLVEVTPDATLKELRDQLPVQVCIQTVANELTRLKLTYKKNSFTQPSKTGPTSLSNGGHGKRT
jgi:transposase